MLSGKILIFEGYNLINQFNVAKMKITVLFVRGY